MRTTRLPPVALAAVCTILLPAVSIRALDLRISEIVAANDGSLLDEDGEPSDWIEIQNAEPFAVDLAGWYLSDDPARPAQWRFPSRGLAAGEYLVVFASGKHRIAATGPLHTSFRLDAAGEELILVEPDGVTVADTLAFGLQREGYSYGRAQEPLRPPALVAGASGRAHVPLDARLATTWTGAPEVEPFDDSLAAGWFDVQTGVGYDQGEAGLRPVAYWPFDEFETSNLAEDVAGGEHHATLTSVQALTGGGAGPRPVYTPDRGGHSGAAGDRALDLGPAGSGAILSVASAFDLFRTSTANDAITISLWLFGDASQPANNMLFWGSSDPGGGGIRSLNAHVPWSDGVIYWDTAGCCDGSQRISRAEPDATRWRGRWNHYVFVKRGDTKEIWQNGALFHDGENTADLTLIRGFLLGGAESVSSTYGGKLDDVAIWDQALSAAEIESLAHGASPLTLRALEGCIASDVTSESLGVGSSLYLRVPFEVGALTASDGTPLTLEDADTVTLRMKYADGFVAYLNGTEVARRNAPGTVRFDSLALSSRTGREAVVAEEIDVSVALDSLRSGANLLAVHALKSSADAPQLLALPELLLARSEGARYLAEPSPGRANESGFAGFVAEVELDHAAGYFDEPFALSLTVATPGAEIWWTRDGSEPDPDDPRSSRYTAPIAIDTTTVFRARAFLGAHEPSPIATASFLSIPAIARQPARPPGLPATWSGGFPADYGMDPDVVDTTIPGYDIDTALRSIPTLSLVADPDDIFGAERGIYYHSDQKSERAASMEWLDLEDESFQIDAGLRVHGLTSRQHNFTPKHSFRVHFKREFGPPKLRFPFYRESDVNVFDELVIKGFSTDSWPVSDGWALPGFPGVVRWERPWAQYLRDQWVKDATLDMGRIAAQGRYAHVFLNGLYWGIYDVTERHSEPFHETHFGGRGEDYDIMKDFNELHSGNRDAWNAMHSLAASGLASDAAYWRIQGRRPDGTRDPSLERYVDVEALADYIILHVFIGADDWPNHNWWAGRRRGLESDGFRFYPWDQEISNNRNNRRGFTSSGYRFETADAPTSPAFLYARLRESARFRRLFADRLHAHLFGDGALTVAACDARWMERATEIDHAVVAESARWGDSKRAVPFKREVEWLAEQSWLRTTYWDETHAIVLQRFRGIGLYPPVDAPVFARHGGRVPAGFELRITASRGRILYTLDGEDPRRDDDSVLPTALETGSETREPVLETGAALRWRVPVDGREGAAWIDAEYDDGAWATGASGVGFDLNPTYRELIASNVEGEAHAQNASVLVRVPFVVDNLRGAADRGAVVGLLLRMKYDDGYVAWLNGREIERRNAPDAVAWNSEAESSHPDNQALVFEELDVSAHSDALREGENLLAIQGLNLTADSSDLLVLPELDLLRATEASGARIDHSARMRARVLDGGTWSALAEATFTVDLGLRITEVQYHPAPPRAEVPAESGFEEGDFEFIEIENLSAELTALGAVDGAETIDLRGVRLAGAVSFEFAGSAVESLAPGEIVVVVRNLEAFASRYDLASILVAGEYSGRLDNRGETLRLAGAVGETQIEIEYDDAWHPETDGDGPSLVWSAIENDPEAASEEASWNASESALGSPGVSELSREQSGRQVPGDTNQDARLDLSDAVALLGHLFLGSPARLPCGEGLISEAGNRALADTSGDGAVNLADAVALLAYLFRGGPAHPLGVECVPIPECPDACAD